MIILDINIYGDQNYEQPNDEEIIIYADNWIFTVDAISNEVGTSC